MVADEDRLPASMRPRVFPAEDRRTRWDTTSAGGFNEAAGIPRGRRGGASNKRSPGRPSFNEAAGIPRGRPEPEGPAEPEAPPASMRPRVFPAEDERLPLSLDHYFTASMRPRVFPAEDAHGAARVPRAACKLQ